VLEKGLEEGDRGVIKDRAMLVAATRVLCDLARQGWDVRVNGLEVQVSMPAELHTVPQAEKARVRNQELIKRNEQLERPSVRKFIQRMERRRPHDGKFVSIFSLMRDGRELAAAIRNTRTLTGSSRTSALRQIIDPYLQLVTEDGRCPHTGFRLQEIWRYFRHTWTNQYMSTPGRTMALLVRDRAAPSHPILGIVAIGSSVVQIKERDTWIGWHPSVFLKRLGEIPARQLGGWLRGVIKKAIAEIYFDDFLEESLLDIAELRNPTLDTLTRLQVYSSKQRRLHHRYAIAREHKDVIPSKRNDMCWKTRARTHLFRSKRALALADLLRARFVIDRHLSAKATKLEIMNLLKHRDGRHAAAKILRKAKADRVGTAIADITVCGAVPPYNPLLGGKLIAMLAVGPEVIAMYQKRYGRACSEIASSMAARPIVRPAELVFLGTTSLYSIGSSQYNRVRIPAERVGGECGKEIRYLELGQSESFGTSQYSTATVEALVDLVQQTNGGQRVNSIFGEGVSPKFRKIREGLDVLKFPAENLLRHGRRRIVYGVTVVNNTREFLLGMEDRPKYMFSSRGPDTTRKLADWWCERWLSRRIEQDKVLEEVESHTLLRPIRHGARVMLPEIDTEDLFSASELT
jgi:hypothetical protein